MRSFLAYNIDFNLANESKNSQKSLLLRFEKQMQRLHDVL